MIGPGTTNIDRTTARTGPGDQTGSPKKTTNAAPERERLARPSASHLKQLRPIIGLTPLIIGLLAWQFAVGPDSFTFPPPSEWWNAAREMWATDELQPALRRTLTTFFLGSAASVVLGAAIGWFIGASRTADRALGPSLELVRATPAPALVPVATVLFGVTTQMSVVIMLVSVIWPVLLSTAAARASIPPVRLDAGRVLGLGPITRMRKIVLPSLLPEIMTGARVTVSLGFVVSLLVDIIGAGAGIGRLLVVKQQSFDAASVWAVLVVIGLFGLIANALVAAAEGRVRRGWL